MTAVSAALATTIFAGGTVTYGGLLTAVALGVSTYSTMTADSGGVSGTPLASRIESKAEAQREEQLDAAELGDSESEKRKRLAAKSKFKIEKDEPVTLAETGVNLGDKKDAPTGVQI